MIKIIICALGIISLNACFLNSNNSTNEHQQSTYSEGDDIESYAGNDTLQAILKSAYKKAEKIKGLRSLIVLQGNEIVAEKYFRKYSKDSLDHVRSVTKSFLSTLVGIAVDQDLIESVDDQIGKYLSKHPLSEKQKQIKIRDLLTMSGGMEWGGDAVKNYNSWASYSNHIDFILDRKAINPPGSKFVYNPGDPHLISMIISDVSGMSTKEYAEKHLFKPLGIKKSRWQFVTNYHSGAAGLEVSPRSMLRLGQMFKNGGVYNGKRIVSQEWVAEATQIHQSLAKDETEESGYGYFWWTMRLLDEDPFYGAVGFAGQNILVIPTLDLVLVTTCEWLNMKGKTDEQSQAVSNLIGKDIAQAYYLKRHPELEYLVNKSD